jgi:hypothetical protein
MVNIYKYLLRWALRLLTVAALVIAILWVLDRTSIFPSVSTWFKPKPVLIDNTPLVIKEVRQIAELNTMQLYAELVVDSTEYTKPNPAITALRAIGLAPLPAISRQLVLIAKGRVKAGIDLKQIEAVATGDSVSIRLPKATITEVITNPADFETFVENGYWTNTEVIAVKEKARRQLLGMAWRQNLPAKADARARQVLELFLRQSGFRVVTFVTL